MTDDYALRFQSFSSGSSGNCYYLGTRQGGILIDAGVGIRTLKTDLARIGLTYDHIAAVLVTHDHADHIRSLGSYCKRLGKPVWMTPVLAGAMAIHWATGPYLGPVLRLFPEKGPAEIVPGRILATPFIVPHDATQTAGYSIEFDGVRFVIMTDIGAMTEEALGYARMASTVVVEANYDAEMLRSGPYPPELQERIRSGHGHLSNAQTAQAIRDFMHEGLRNVFLCHLSANNNTPELALAATRPAVEGTGVRLEALPRTSPSAFFEL